jgi:hypothetical protein
MMFADAIPSNPLRLMKNVMNEGAEREHSNHEEILSNAKGSNSPTSGGTMDQASFEQAILEVLHQVPEQHRVTILALVQDFVKEQIHLKTKPTEPAYSVERHQEIRKLTTTIRGTLAEAITAEREERG